MAKHARCLDRVKPLEEMQIAVAQSGVRVFLFDQPWNREVKGDRITRVTGWTDLAERLELS